MGLGTKARYEKTGKSSNAMSITSAIVAGLPFVAHLFYKIGKRASWLIAPK